MNRIYMNLHDNAGCGHYRAKMPVKHCSPILKEEGIDLEMPDQMDVNAPYDAYVFHRLIAPQFFPYLVKIKKRGQRIVWELDDNLFKIPDDNPAKGTMRAEQLESLKLCLEWADDIIVSTEQLKDQIGHTHKTTVLPNLIDLEDYPRLRDNQETMKPFRSGNLCKILWAGSNTHKNDIELVVPALQEIADKYKDKVQFIFFGQVPDVLLDLPQTTYIDGLPFTNYAHVIQLIQPDIALCPLLDHEFNRAKSPIKWLEMTLAGAATVASRVGPYQDVIDDKVTGFLVDGDWFTPLDALFSIKVVAERLWSDACYEVHKNHSWQYSEKKDLWLDFFRKVVN